MNKIKPFFVLRSPVLKVCLIIFLNKDYSFFWAKFFRLVGIQLTVIQNVIIDLPEDLPIGKLQLVFLNSTKGNRIRILLLLH